MKKLYFLLALLITASATLKLQAQTKATDYSFQTYTGAALEDMSGAVTIMGANAEDYATDPITFFPFKFLKDAAYTQFSVSSNGIMGLGAQQVYPYSSSMDNPLAQSPTQPVFAPWADVLTTGTNGSVKYKITTAASGLRKLVVEFKERNYTDDGSSSNYNKTWQVWLFEGTNVIQYVYGNAGFYDYDNSVTGISGAQNDYEVVNTATHTKSNNEFYTINHDWPGAGRTYVFAPPGVTVTIPALAPITVGSTTSANVTCPGSNNGSIALQYLSGGDGNYTINFTGANGFTANTAQISNLAPGTYTYIIADGANTTPVTGSIVITEPSPVVFTPVATNVTCNGGNNGSIVIANNNYTYTWTKVGDESFSASSNSINGLTAGTYKYSATNANGCAPVTGQVVIEEPAPIVVATATSTNVSCYGQSNGSITLGAISGGSGTYTVNWTADNGFRGAGTAISGLSAGVYTYIVTDAKGCSSEASQVVITEPEAVKLSATSTNITCNGAANGHITVSTDGVYVIKDSTGKIIPNNTVNFASGVYTITATRAGANGASCTATPITVDIDEPEAVTLSAIDTDVTAAGANNGHITVTTNGTYVIKNAAGAVIPNSTVNFAPGIYTITASRAGGNAGDVCTATPVTVEITQPQPTGTASATATTVVINVTCNGNSDGSATVVIKNPSGTYTYVWVNSANKLMGTTATINGLPAGTYTAYVFDKGKSVFTVKATVAQPQLLTVTAKVTSNFNGAQISCASANDGVIKLTTAGGNGAFTFTLYGLFMQPMVNTTGVFSNLGCGIYFYIVKDNKGCDPVQGFITITAPLAISASVSMSPLYPVTGAQAQTIYLGYGVQSVNLSVTGVTGGTNTAGYTYSWSPATGLSNAKIAAPNASPTVTTNYTVTIKDVNGCTVTKTITVYVVDARCGSKVSMCKYGKLECIAVNDVKSRLSSGYTLGACNSSSANSAAAPSDIETIGSDLDNETTGSNSAVETIVSSKGLNVFPNPTTGQFSVELNGYKSAKATVAVLNVKGSIVAQTVLPSVSNGQKVSFNLSAQASGVYFIKVINEDGVRTSKVFVQH